MSILCNTLIGTFYSRILYNDLFLKWYKLIICIRTHVRLIFSLCGNVIYHLIQCVYCKSVVWIKFAKFASSYGSQRKFNIFLLFVRFSAQKDFFVIFLWYSVLFPIITVFHFFLIDSYSLYPLNDVWTANRENLSLEIFDCWRFIWAFIWFPCFCHVLINYDALN